MKRFFALMLALILVIPMAVTVKAENEPSLSLENVSAGIGRSVEMKLYMSNNPGLVALNLKISYDENMLELVSVEKGSILTGPISVNTANGKILLEAEDIMHDATADGVLATLTFNVISTAEEGNYFVSASTISGSNAALSRVTPSSCEGTVTAVAVHEHDYALIWSKSETQHWHACAGCDEKKNVGSHVYDNDCDTDCNVCGYKRVTSHEYYSKWLNNSTKHWHACSICGDKKNVAEHDFVMSETESGVKICTVCGYKASSETYHTHSFTEKNVDEQYLKSTATCISSAIYYYSCACGERGSETFEYGEALAHEPGSAWLVDDSYHWHICSVCGNVIDKAAHDMKLINDRASTVTESGLQHEECEICGFWGDVVEIPMLAPAMIDGDNGRWEIGSGDELRFSSNASFDDFIAVLVDGEIIDEVNYTVQEGSIIVTLKTSFTETLSPGKHTLTIRSVGGDATAIFEIAAAPNAHEGSYTWAIIAAAAVVVVGVSGGAVVFATRKKRAA